MGLGRLSERPAAPNVTQNTPLSYRLNKNLAYLHTLFFRQGLRYLALDSHASLQEIRRSGKSFIRFGDGEAKLMLGADWPTQLWSKALAEGLYRIFKDYSPSSNYLVGVANSRLTLSMRELKKINRHRTWRNARYCLRKYLQADSGLPFLEANLFRIGADELKQHEIDALWATKTHVIIIHNRPEYLEWFRHTYPQIETYLVQIPDKNFFEKLPETEAQILELTHQQHLKKETLAILIAAGPGGKILNHRLCQRSAGYLCYDMGNFFHMRLNRKLVLAELEKRNEKYLGDR
jgi:hypothetical protein